MTTARHYHHTYPSETATPTEPLFHFTCVCVMYGRGASCTQQNHRPTMTVAAYTPTGCECKAPSPVASNRLSFDATLPIISQCTSLTRNAQRRCHCHRSWSPAPCRPNPPKRETSPHVMLRGFRPSKMYPMPIVSNVAWKWSFHTRKTTPHPIVTTITRSRNVCPNMTHAESQPHTYVSKEDVAIAMRFESRERLWTTPQLVVETSEHCEP